MTAIAIKPSQRPFSEIGKFFRKFINSPEIVKVSAKKSLGIKAERLVNDLQKIKVNARELGDLVPFFEAINSFEQGLTPHERALLSKRFQRFLAITVGAEGKWNRTPQGVRIAAEYIYVQDPNGVPMNIPVRSVKDLLRDTTDTELENPDNALLSRVSPAVYYFKVYAKTFMHDRLQFIQKIYLDEFTAVERHS